jgi:hypothetical protein
MDPEQGQQQGPQQNQEVPLPAALQHWMNQANATMAENQQRINHLTQNEQANQAAAAAAAAAAAQNMPRGYKPEGPPKYHGRTGEDVEAWLFQMEEGNRLFPIVDQVQRIRYTALSLRETAAKWYSSMQMTDPPQIVDWESFTTKLRQQFVHLDQKWVARNTIYGLKQTGNVRDYSVKFRNLLILIPDMSMPDALDKYIRGLKDFAWKVWRRKFTNLEEAMVYAEELDLEVQQKSILTGRNVIDYRKRADHNGPAASRPVPWQSRPEPTGFHRDGSTPMEIGMMKMSETERNRHYEKDLCFNCHKPGHRANLCPTKTSMSGNGVGRK